MATAAREAPAKNIRAAARILSARWRSAPVADWTRPVGAAPDQLWQWTTTENISRSGLRFTAKVQLRKGTPIQMRFVLGLGTVTSEVACRGRIARRARVHRDVETTAYAATIEAYQLIPIR